MNERAPTVNPTKMGTKTELFDIVSFFGFNIEFENSDTEIKEI